ncbi:MAG TPA: CHAT domain-containing tetratricopeptide repeat protein [Pyrinomonadaceae bacterium]
MLARISRLSLIAWLVLVALSVQAQNASVGSSEEDERAATIEQRQALLTDLLARVQNERNKGDFVAAANLLQRAGRLQARLHQPDEALATYREVLALTKRTPNLSAEVDSLNGMAAIYAGSSKCIEADQVLARALALTKSGNYEEGKAESLLVLSDCQNHSDRDLALLTAKDSLVVWQSVNSKWGMAKAYMTIGDYQLSQNELEAATESLEAALGLWKELNVPAEQGEALINMGFIAYRRGAWQNSILLLSQAQSLLDEQAEPYRMGQITGGLAEAFIESGLPEIGLEKLKLATEYFRRANSPRALIVMYWDIGKAHYLNGNYDRALENLNLGWSEAQSIDEPIFGALCAEYLGRTYTAIHDYGKALQHYQWALSRYGTSNPMEAARTTALVGQVHQLQGRLPQARQQYVRVLSAFRRLGDQLNESATLYALGRLELEANRLDIAEDYLNKSIQATENIRRVSTSNDLAAAFSASVHDRYQSFVECLLRKQQLHPSAEVLREAFEKTEFARGRSLIEFLNATQTNIGGSAEPALAETERRLRQQLRVKEDYRVTLLARQYHKEELVALDSEINRLDADYRQVIDQIKTRNVLYDQITQPRAWDLSQIQQKVIVDDDTVLLEYSLGPDRSHVFALTRNELTSFDLPAESAITAAAGTLYQLLSGDQKSTKVELDEAGQKLAGLILAPVAAKLDKRRLIIVADGALHYIPFQMLPSPLNDEPLVATHEIINAPSATILGQLQQDAAQRRAPKNIVAAFGDPVFDSNYAVQKINASENNSAPEQNLDDYRSQSFTRNFELAGDSVDPSKIQPLFYARKELMYLRGQAGEASLVATGFAASLETLKTTDLSQYAILHLATHGVLDPKRPENSGFFLSMVGADGKRKNGFVSLDDIYGLRAPVDLVVLSACRTGLGKEMRGEGMIGLTRGFMYAGASSVLASLWKVDDEATAELMKRFYTNLLERKLPPAAALREAQNSFRGDSVWNSPYYWAAFTIQGDYRNPIVVQPDPHSVFELKLIGAVSLLLIVALFFSYRRMLRSLAYGT